MTGTPSPEALRRFGAHVDFGQTAEDYAAHRAGFPARFFDLLADRGWLTDVKDAVDLGTGAGTVARGLALKGIGVIGIDPAEDLLNAARALDAKAGVSVAYRTGTAERTGLTDA